MKNTILYVLVIISILMNIVQMIYTPQAIKEQRNLTIRLDSMHRSDCEWRDSSLVGMMYEQDIIIYKELNKRIKHEKDTITIVRYSR